MKLKALYKTLSRPPKKSKPKTIKELETLKLHVVLEPEDLIVQHVDKQDSGCWFWKGSKDKYGYGQIKVGGVLKRTHRFAYEVYYGEFDKKLHVCHHCDQPSCINPDHLFLGNAKDNATDRAAKGRQGSNTKRLSFEQREGIAQGLREGKSRHALAVEFDVHERTVGRVKARLNDTRHPTTTTSFNMAKINATDVLAHAAPGS
jgi:hypothetical protein